MAPDREGIQKSMQLDFSREQTERDNSILAEWKRFLKKRLKSYVTTVGSSCKEEKLLSEKKKSALEQMNSPLGIKSSCPNFLFVEWNIFPSTTAKRKLFQKQKDDYSIKGDFIIPKEELTEEQIATLTNTGCPTDHDLSTFILSIILDTSSEDSDEELRQNLQALYSLQQMIEKDNPKEES